MPHNGSSCPAAGVNGPSTSRASSSGRRGLSWERWLGSEFHSRFSFPSGEFCPCPRCKCCQTLKSLPVGEPGLGWQAGSELYLPDAPGRLTCVSKYPGASLTSSLYYRRLGSVSKTLLARCSVTVQDPDGDFRTSGLLVRLLLVLFCF